MSELVKTNPDDSFNFGIFNDFRKHYKEALIAYDREKITPKAVASQQPFFEASQFKLP